MPTRNDKPGKRRKRKSDENSVVRRKDSPRQVDIDAAAQQERLRQCQETFNQNKKHDSRWFWLRLIMGYGALGLVSLVAIGSLYVLCQPDRYLGQIQLVAGTALFGSVLSGTIGLWKVVLSPRKREPLSPILTLPDP